MTTLDPVPGAGERTTGPAERGTAGPARERRAARPERPARAGYLVAGAIDLALVSVVTVGWRAVPVLTEDFTRVLGPLVASLLLGAAVQVLYVAYDPLWLRRLGDAVTTAVGLAVLVLLVRVFPFDLGTWDWAVTSLRVLLVAACVGTAIGVLVNLVLAVQAVAAGPAADR